MMYQACIRPGRKPTPGDESVDKGMAVVGL